MLYYFSSPPLLGGASYLDLESGIGSYFITLNTIALVLFYFQVFENDPRRQKIKSWSIAIPLAIIIILFLISPFIALPSVQTLLVFVFIIAIVFFILLAHNSRKLQHRLSEALDKHRMQYLSYMGSIITVSYLCTLTFQIIASTGFVFSLLVLALIPAFIGVIAMAFLFIAFFPPDRLAEKWVPDAELPRWTWTFSIARGKMSLPKLAHEIVQQKQHSCEWWVL